VPGGFYHATLRGNHREPIFRVPSDRRELDNIVGEATARHGSSVHAYCWMTNHLHLLVQVGESPLGCTMHAIAMRYARRFQRAVPTTGHLFEHRYRARLVDADTYLLDVVRYIHLNPVAAGMVHRAEEYEWSSHCGYVGRPAVSWLTTGFVLAMFDENPERAHESYARFVSAGRDDARARNPDDDPERDTPSQPVPVSTCRVHNPALEVLIAEMCASAGVDPSEVALPSRDRVVSDLRAGIAIEAMRRGIAGMAEIAARMGRHPSSLTRLLRRRR
jgi:REP element-mobilizing transposase RayT